MGNGECIKKESFGYVNITRRSIVKLGTLLSNMRNRYFVCQKRVAGGEGSK
jgi:hypothetical protein